MSVPAPTAPASTTVVVRPLATPLPLGFLGLFVATSGFASFQLSWIDAEESHVVALAVLALTVPVQLLASVLGFLCRDPIAGTGMGILAGTWAGASLATLSGPPGAASSGLGMLLITAGIAMLVPAVAGLAKPVAALVMGLSATRFVVTGVAETSGSDGWLVAAGWVGIVLAAVSLYAALAFELEGSQGRAVLPLARRGRARAALHDDLSGQLATVAREAGVRQQL